MAETLNDLAFWYPRVAPLVPTPATWIVRTDVELAYLLDGEAPPGLEAFIDELRRAGDEAGWPCFLRTSHGSGKHDWKHTCFVESADQVPARVAALVEWSAMVDFFGLPTTTWVVRELLHTSPAFSAFWGDMPVTKERRYFVVDGKVIGHHPYWPPEAIEGHTEDPDWRSKLDELNRIHPAEVRELTEMTKQIGNVLEGDWSVDWLWTVDRGWVLIDMALASESYCWYAYPTAPDPAALGHSARQDALDALFGQKSETSG